MCSIAQASAPAVTPAAREPSEWRQWGTWSSCTHGHHGHGPSYKKTCLGSITCGSGYRTRNRECRIGNDGSICAGRNSETETCNSGFCPWMAWNSCSKSCDGGEQSRSRYCPGGGCEGIGEQRKDCNVMHCVMWSVWNSWTSCSRTCGVAVRKRTRSCSGPACNSYRNGAEEQVEQCTPK